MPNKTVKNLTLVVAVVVFASALAMAQAAEAQTTLTGTVSCEARVNHLYTCQRNQTQQSCTLACVAQGSRFVLLVGGMPYLLQGDSRELKTYAGGKTTVTGVALSDRIEVQTASSAKHNMPGESMPSSMSSNASKSSDNSQGKTE
jgi:hypothetical protein